MILKFSYEDGECIFGNRPITKNSTTEALEALAATLNFIDVWLRLLDQNGEVRCGMNNRAMKNIFQTIPTIKSKPLSQGKKIQRPKTEIGRGL